MQLSYVRPPLLASGPQHPPLLRKSERLREKGGVRMIRSIPFKHKRQPLWETDPVLMVACVATAMAASAMLGIIFVALVVK